METALEHDDDGTRPRLRLVWCERVRRELAAEERGLRIDEAARLALERAERRERVEDYRAGW